MDNMEPYGRVSTWIPLQDRDTLFEEANRRGLDHQELLREILSKWAHETSAATIQRQHQDGKIL